MLGVESVNQIERATILNELSEAAEMKAGALRRFLKDVELLPGTKKT
jgi:hypothetical protein